MKLWKTTLVVLTDYEPCRYSPYDLARDSVEGDSFLYSREVESIGLNEFDEEVMEFFNGLDESDD